MTLLLAYLAIAIGVSFLCSVLEAVLLSEELEDSVVLDLFFEGRSFSPGALGWARKAAHVSW